MNYLLIANPVSGPKKDTDALLSKVTEKITTAGHQCTLRTTEYEGHGFEIAQKAIGMGYDAIIAIGGDGTVNEIARALIDTDQPLGILPNGSGNGLARELRMPMDPMHAVDTLLRHEVIDIDTCEANGVPFFVTCGIGFDGKISKEFASSKSRGLATYARETISQYFDYEPREYHLMIDDKEVTCKAFLIAIANASQYGNNAFIAPGASMTDGILDVTILRAFPTLDVGKIVFQLFSKELEKNEYVAQYRGKRIVIKALKPVNYHIDGEPMDKTEELVIEVHSSSLKVLHGRSEDREKTVFDFFRSVTNSFNGFTDDMLKLLN